MVWWPSLGCIIYLHPIWMRDKLQVIPVAQFKYKAGLQHNQVIWHCHSPFNLADWYYPFYCDLTSQKKTLQYLELHLVAHNRCTPVPRKRQRHFLDRNPAEPKQNYFIANLVYLENRLMKQHQVLDLPGHSAGLHMIHSCKVREKNISMVLSFAYKHLKTNTDQCKQSV